MLFVGQQVPGTPIAPAEQISRHLMSVISMPAVIFGQCGTTSEFCTISESPTGAAGLRRRKRTAVSLNCGTRSITSDAPAEFMRVGFFEGYNLDRPCTNMLITSFNMSGYTDIVLRYSSSHPRLLRRYYCDPGAIRSVYINDRL